MASPVPVDGLADGVACAPLPRGRDDNNDDPTESEEDGSLLMIQMMLVLLIQTKATRSPKQNKIMERGKLEDPREARTRLHKNPRHQESPRKD